MFSSAWYPMYDPASRDEGWVVGPVTIDGTSKPNDVKRGIEPKSLQYRHRKKNLMKVMKVLKRVIAGRVRKIVKFYNMQFGFIAGRSTTDPVFIVCRDISRGKLKSNVYFHYKRCLGGESCSLSFTEQD